MELIRLVLVGGLVVHKLVWEMYKVGSTQASAVRRPLSRRLKLIKLAKTAFLVFLIVQALFLNILPISANPYLIQAVGLTLYLMGLALAIAGRVQLGKNWANIEDAHVRREQTLVLDGIYQYIRHPIYVGDSLLLIGFELALNSWMVVAILIPVAIFVQQALSEEQLLAQSFGDYASYRKQTKRFIPFVF